MILGLFLTKFYRAYIIRCLLNCLTITTETGTKTIYGKINVFSIPRVTETGENVYVALSWLKGTNMRIFLSICFYIFVSSFSANAEQIDDLSKTVVFLRQTIQKTFPVDGNSVPIWYRLPNNQEFVPVTETSGGTGFLVGYKEEIYLVTAKHVAHFLQPTGEIIFNLSGGKGVIMPFHWLLKQDAIKGAHWFDHPKADISIHPMAFRTDIALDLQIINEDLFSKPDMEIRLLNKVNVIGFPLGLGVTDKISPIAKETKVASKLTTLAIKGVPPDLKHILLDQALSQGYSGAPVFYMEDQWSNSSIEGQRFKIGESVRLLGLQSSALSDVTGGKLSTVVPISYLSEIFGAPEFQVYMKARGK